MFFLDPMCDIAFKKLFGSQEKKEILMSFLNSVLGCKEGYRIVDVKITDPYNIPDAPWLKTSIVDVRCIDQQGKHYIIELQVESQDDYPERSQYYSSLAIARQLKKGWEYGKVMPVVFIGVLAFDLFDNADYLSHHKILNTKTHQHALKHLEFHFIELKKFNKTLEELDDTIIDKWIYLLKNASDLNTIPKQLKSPIVLQEAMEVLEEGNMTPEELAAYDRLIDAERVAKSIKKTREKKLRQKFEKIAENREKKGRQAEKEAMALKLLSKLSIEEVANIIGLSRDDIKKIKKTKENS